MTKIIYFTAAAVPTGTEQGHIDALKSYPGITLVVRNAAMVGNTDETPEEADYVANATGANFPVGYTDTDDYPITTAAAPPQPTLLGTEKIIRSGVEFAAPALGGAYVNGYTPTIADGVVTALAGS